MKKTISNKNLKALLIILGIIFVVSTVISNDFSNKSDNISSIDENSEVKNDTNLKTGDFWSEAGIFFIDDTGWSPPWLPPTQTWSDFNQSHEWCNGAGTWDDPYVIENVTFSSWYKWCIFIQNSSVPFIINNCTIKDSGLLLANVNNSLITNNKIMNNNHSGILACDLNNSTISGNYVRGNGFRENKTAGIALSNGFPGISGIPGTYYSCNNKISGNTVYNNSNGIALRAGADSNYSIVHCHNNTISGNNVTENRGYGIVIDIFGGEDDAENNRIYSSNNSITNNNVTFNCWGERYESCGIGYKITGEENAIIYNNFTTISGNNITGNINDGLLVDADGEDAAVLRVNNITISGNIINNNNHSYYDPVREEWRGGDGIRFVSDEDDNSDVELKYNNIVGNIVKNNSEVGIRIDGDGNSHNTISANNVTENNAGIFIWESDYNDILGNNASFNNDYGILLYQSDYNIISTNNVTNNTLVGIYLYRSDYNNVTWNTLGGNGYCILDHFCKGNIYEHNSCDPKYIRAPVVDGDGDDDDDDDDDDEEAIPGYDLYILISTIFILLGAIYIISIKKRL